MIASVSIEARRSPPCSCSHNQWFQVQLKTLPELGSDVPGLSSQRNFAVFWVSGGYCKRQFKSPYRHLEDSELSHEKFKWLWRAAQQADDRIRFLSQKWIIGSSKFCYNSCWRQWPMDFSTICFACIYSVIRRYRAPTFLCWSCLHLF